MTSIGAVWLKPTDLLQATNLCLRAIGQNPVTSLDNLGVDGSIALAHIGEVSREVQNEGFEWNTDPEFVIDPNEDGEVALPSNTLEFRQDYLAETYNKQIVQRGMRLYDRTNHTFIIGSSVKGTLKVILEFEDLPEAARSYIAYEAASRTAAFKTVSTTIVQLVRGLIGPARIRLDQAQYNADGTTLKDNPHFRRTRRR